MKELSIKEKAEAYDNVVDKLRRFLAQGVDPLITRADVQDFFPELKESKDEKIRKALIDFFKDAKQGLELQERDNNQWQIEQFKIFIDWLEKQQGEQKPIGKAEPTPIFRIGDTLKRKGKDYTFIVDRIQGGYYHCDNSNGAFFPIEEQDNWELIKQNHWSEEDEDVINHLLAICAGAKRYRQFAGCLQDDITKYQTWLKSLKDRVGCEVNCTTTKEWSEEDEHGFENCLYAIKETFKGVDNPHRVGTINFLKSLKDRYTWKPSEEHMDALNNMRFAVEHFGPSASLAALDDLYNKLEKLREE